MIRNRKTKKISTEKKIKPIAKKVGRPIAQWPSDLKNGYYFLSEVSEMFKIDKYTVRNIFVKYSVERKESKLNGKIAYKYKWNLNHYIEKFYGKAPKES